MQMCNEAPDPLVPLLVDHPTWIDATGRFVRVDFEGLAIVFLAIGADATDNEMGDAFVLASRCRLNSVTTIGVLLPPEDGCVVGAPTQPSGSAEVGMSDLLEVMDAHVDVPIRALAEHQQGLLWLLTTLRRLHQDGLFILEPAWDLNDLLETLDLPGAKLKLAVRSVEQADSVEAVNQAIIDLQASSADLQSASGLLVVLWQSSTRRLTVREVRDAGWHASQALGQGGMHMVLVARAPGHWIGVGACATLVASWPRRFPPLGGAT
ncbi:MAG: hypothetical protein DI563_00480 [Variovorax paradoxus]|uniref:Uncharacterized protein n=1 Tax=Variovorax paradoxus TaxID=34073 RepID=A0A2W5QIB6_VARPD|nr:MAG: hypothetical protein DI563_00480 [Variovorax paradoxus]